MDARTLCFASISCLIAGMGLFLCGGCQPTASSTAGSSGSSDSKNPPIAASAERGSTSAEHQNSAAPRPDDPDGSSQSSLAIRDSASGERGGRPAGSGVETTQAEPTSPSSLSSARSDEPAASKPQEPSQHERDDQDQDSTSYREPIFEGWGTPLFAVVVSGRQNGYLEPCGCTGLANQKGGLARRATLLEQLRQRRWPLVVLDLGNQVRRFGRQPEIQFQVTADALKMMGYDAVTFGPADLRLTIDELAATTARTAAESDRSDSMTFLSANVAILDRQFTPRFRLVTVSGKRVALVGVLGDQYVAEIQAAEILVEPARQGLQKAWQEISQAGGCDYAVLLAHATRGEAIALAQAVPHFDLVVTTGGGDIPPSQMEPIEGTGSQLFWVGAKGMYVCVVGLYPGEANPWRYQRVPLDNRFPDHRAMLDLLATYQRQLERLGLEGLGLKPLPHPSGRQFVGSAVCGDCHTKAYAVWKETPHAHATDSIVHPTERSEIPRHFDPECLSCHVTGWNPQRFTPYASGYWSLDSTPRMVGNGCENCHGPGSAHVEAEEGGADDEVRLMLRHQMRLLLSQAEKKCIECHDLDNSPDFHVPGAFEKYWQRIAHPGKD